MLGVDWLPDNYTSLQDDVQTGLLFFFSSTLFRMSCKALSVISAARLAALITSFIHQLGEVYPLV